MSEEKNTLKIINETITAVELIPGVLKKAKEELAKLENDKAKLEKEKDRLEKEKNELEREKERLVSEKTALESDQGKLKSEKEKLEVEKIRLVHDKEKLEKETKLLEKEKQERDEKIGALTEEQMKLLDEYKSLQVELSKLSSIAAEHEEAEFNFERIKALLSIYIVLLEEIWQGQPHFRILATMHGDKKEMTREELKNTTGISGAMVLRAIHELAGADIISYDENTGKAKLLKRLFEKKALD